MPTLRGWEAPATGTTVVDMRSVAALTCIVAVLAAPAVARAEFTVAETTRPTPVSAYAGSLIWSRYDAALAQYRLMETHASPAGAQTTALPVPPRSVPFDADIGPDATGAPTVVYSRCTTEPQVAGTALPGPAGCPCGRPGAAATSTATGSAPPLRRATAR